MTRCIAVRAPCFALLAALAALAGGCSSAASLVIELRTDLAGGVEFTSIRTEVRNDAGEVLRAAEIASSPPADWSRPRRIAELSGLAPGEVLLNVSLFDARGRVTAQRTVRVSLAHDRVALTVLITRDCRGVMCPGAGDDALASSCLGGRCVSPDCSELNPTACPMPLCRAATDCPAPTVSCASADCVEGVCVSAPNGRCAMNEYCDLATDCTPYVPMMTMDAGPDAAGSDAGSDAGATGCVDGTPCDTGDPCAVGSTHCVAGVPECRASAAAPASTVCRPAVGDCDVAETCGGAMTCPPDALAAMGHECRASSGECDAAEVCSGASVDCPIDRDAANGTICSTGVCNVGSCVPCMAGLPCATGHACERGTIDCSTATPTCRAGAPLGAGTSCRDAVGPCDAAETCDGTSRDCPADRFLDASAICRPATDACDVADACNGSGAACPADAFAPATTVCRPSAGVCDAADRCTGTSAACPGDLLLGSGFPCRAAIDVCDVAEACTGTAVDCPSDARVPAGASVCRPMNGLCDRPETCDGTHASCPADGFATPGTSCRAATGACDAPEVCTGGGAACPSDGNAPDGTSCSGGVCSGGTCTPCTNGLPCTAGRSACERGTIDCSSGSPVCVGAGPQSMGTVCRASAGPCDLQEVCDGSSLSCPANAFANGPTCRMASGICDVAERCDGTSAACPADGFALTGAMCAAETCGPFGACVPTSCALDTGNQTRSCMTPTCNAGSCSGSSSRMDTASCVPSTSCGDGCCTGTELGDTCSSDCGPFPSGLMLDGPILYGPEIGGAGGMPFEDTCPADMVLLAFSLDTTASLPTTWMVGVIGWCGPLSYMGVHGTPPTITISTAWGASGMLPVHGSAMGANIDCASNEVVTGLGMSVDGPFPQHVRAVESHCSPITMRGNRLPGATFQLGMPRSQILVPQNPVGGAPGPLMVADCPAGTVARGVRGAMDPDGLLRFGLLCQNVSPR